MNTSPVTDHLNAPSISSKFNPAWLMEVDWSRTVLGAMPNWPAPLLAAASMMMEAPTPLLLVWGAQEAVFFNGAFAREFLQAPSAAVGQPLSSAMPALASELHEALKAVQSIGPQLLDELALSLPLDAPAEDGDGPVLTCCLAPCADETGGVGGVLLSFFEAGSRQREQTQLRLRMEQQWRLFQQAPGFICTLNGPQHRFEFVNDEYVRLFGDRDFIGRTVREAFPELQGQGLFEVLDQVRATGLRHVSRGRRIMINGTAGEPQPRWLDFIYAPIHGADGNVEGIFCEGHDCTEWHQAQATLAEREEQLRLATEAADVGLWDVDMVRETLFWPPRVKAMFGISPEVPVSMADYYAGLHPEDRERVSSAFAAACDPQQRALYDVEYRTVGKEDGVLRHVAAKGRGIFEGDRCVRVIGTAIDISRRKADEEALRASAVAHRESARRKDQFIATLAHELRNPLAPLRNTLAVLEARGQRTPEHALMQRQVEHLVRLVDDLMEVSRISNGAFELRKQAVDVADVIHHAIETSRPLLEQRRHEVIVQADFAAQVMGDPVRLAQILANLLNNAARFTPEGGTVTVACTASDTDVIVAVTDTGQGFTPDRQERIFEMFSRGSDSRGLGIGLALSRRLAEMHGGSLDAASPGPGLGATFELRLPRVPSELAVARGQEATAALLAQADPDASLPSVLVVDDNVDAADATATLLGMMTRDVRVAYSGETALARCAESMPTLMLLDIGMPGMDGYEVARQVRHLPGGDNVVIAALSGWGQPEDRRRGVAAGFDHHLVKPAAPEALQQLLENLAAARR